jgi:hypothetical protein
LSLHYDRLSIHLNSGELQRSSLRHSPTHHRHDQVIPMLAPCQAIALHYMHAASLANTSRLVKCSAKRNNAKSKASTHSLRNTIRETTIISELTAVIKREKQFVKDAGSAVQAFAKASRIAASSRQDGEAVKECKDAMDSLSTALMGHSAKCSAK